jgi:CubicO group peptidase (beta-lactamase class C family)
VVIKEHITGPLGMHNTTFLTDDGSGPTHRRCHEGRGRPVGLHRGDPQPVAGLVGRRPRPVLHPWDYIRFERALPRGGELDGVRILRRATVDEAFTDQIGELNFPEEIETADPATGGPFRPGPSHKWGLGLLLDTEMCPGCGGSAPAPGRSCATGTSS